jgi:hypothetical protein
MGPPAGAQRTGPIEAATVENPIANPVAHHPDRERRVVTVKDVRVERPHTLPRPGSPRVPLRRASPVAVSRAGVSRSRARLNDPPDPVDHGRRAAAADVARPPSPRDERLVPKAVAAAASGPAARATASRPVAAATEPALSIGQIDVTVVHQPPPAAARRAAADARPADTLTALLPARGLKWLVYKP